MLLAGPFLPAQAQTTLTPASAPRAIIAEAQAIAPGGIDDLKTVTLGGIRQWIHVRGNNPDNPILLILHGGPGSPLMGKSWIFQRPWEDYFTVVEWDQRGAGKTFSQSGSQTLKAMTLDQIESDTEQLIDLLRSTYHKNKIFLMAHSFGSVIGVRVAQHRPDALYAYIGVGQVVNAWQNEAIGYQETLAKAKAVGSQAAVRALLSIAPYPGAAVTPQLLAKVAIERHWDVALGGMRYGRATDPEAAFWSLSPDDTQQDVRAAALGERLSPIALAGQLMAVDFDDITAFKCPVFIFAGASDRTTPVVLAKHFLAHVRAPKKAFFEIPRASHDVMLDAQGVMLVDLVTEIRPLAEGHGGNESGVTGR